MITRAIILPLLLLGGASQASIQLSQTDNQLVPDGSPTGLAKSFTISGQAGTVEDLTVNLDITGTWNGDLYAYLSHGTGFAVLLNRVGSTPTDIYGYGDSGLNVTFSDNAANGNIHYYQQVTTPATGAALTGTWAPDGRNVSPYTVTGLEPSTATLSSFDGLNVNGPWTLFVADVSGGNLNYLTSWGLDINTVAPVPEPADFGALSGALLLAGSGWQLWRNKRTVEPKGHRQRH